MAFTSGNDFKAQVLAATDLVALIGQSMKLTQKGRDYWGLCPFHGEKSPSFKVDPAKGYFYCFGCKATGDAFTFVMKRDRVEFKDALNLLAGAAGIEVPQYGAGREKAGEKQKLLDAQSAACAFFQQALAGPMGEAGRRYLAERGINADSIQRFQIGLAPDGWDNLLKSPAGRKFPPPVLVEAGLVKSRENGNGFYDTFRNRLMFPIRDEQGRVIAFGGRVAPGSTDPAKYLNSPETPLFSKGRCVFGLDLARQKIIETRTAAVVEGYTDVIMAHQFGASNVVAVLGVGMTAQHLTILRRFAERVVLLFDPDSAGDAAVDRVVELFLTQPIELAVGTIPNGLDPDEYLLASGLAAFEAVLSDASDVLAYKWKQLSRQFLAAGEEDLTGQQKAVQHYLELLAQARGSGPVDSIRWGMAIARVSRLAGIPEDELNRRFRDAKKPTPARKPANVTAVGMGTGAAENNPPPASAPVERAGPVTARDRAERWILGVLLLEPGRWKTVQARIGVEHFTDSRRRKLAEIYWLYQREEGEPVFREFLRLLDSPSGIVRPADEAPDAGGLVELAVELVEEIEGLIASQGGSTPVRSKVAESRGTPPPPAANGGEILTKALDYLAEQDRERERFKLLAQFRRRSQEEADAGADRIGGGGPASEGSGTETGAARESRDEANLLAEFLKTNQTTNLHRLGPVRRLRG